MGKICIVMANGNGNAQPSPLPIPASVLWKGWWYAEAPQPRDVGAAPHYLSPSTLPPRQSVTSDTALLAPSLRHSYGNDPFSSSNMSDPIAGAAQKHPAPEGLVYTYGTAGVRGRL
jgi:hypothetical protein